MTKYIRKALLAAGALALATSFSGETADAAIAAGSDTFQVEVIVDPACTILVPDIGIAGYDASVGGPNEFVDATATGLMSLDCPTGSSAAVFMDDGTRANRTMQGITFGEFVSYDIRNQLGGSWTSAAGVSFGPFAGAPLNYNVELFVPAGQVVSADTYRDIVTANVEL